MIFQYFLTPHFLFLTRNKIVQIKSVELKSPLNIKYKNKIVCGGGANEKNKRQPSQITGTL